jgi:hypothetical protein
VRFLEKVRQQFRLACLACYRRPGADLYLQWSFLASLVHSCQPDPVVLNLGSKN